MSILYPIPFSHHLVVSLRKPVIFVSSRHKGADPRRRAHVADPLSRFGRNDLCWCSSGRKYKNCHLIGHLSQPGAPTPPDTEDEIFISPDTSVRRDAFTMPRPVPITVQQPTPQAVPISLDEATRALAAKSALPPLMYKDIGTLRFPLLDMNGITDAAAVRAGDHDQALQRLIPDLGDGALQLARATLDRLATDSAGPERPVMLHSDYGEIRRIVGQTLLWADHYLAEDQLAAAAAAGRDDLASYRGPVADLLDLRPLIEAGIVVPVFTDLVVALISTEMDEMVAVDLANPEYVAWAGRQIVLEGPTAREAAFVHVIDDYPHDNWFYLHSPIEPVADGQADDQPLLVHSRLLNHYDPDFDYGPWLATVRRQAIAQLTKLLDIDLGVSAAFGADLLTSSPFRARALRRLRGTLPHSSGYDISGAAWAEVPWLPDAPADLLLKIANSEQRVEELRRATATALRTVESGDIAGGACAITNAAADLRAAASRLSYDLRRQRSLDLALPAGIATGSVLVAGTITPPIVLSAILAAAVPAIPAARARLASRKTAAYAFWMARPR
jgi:hypothetical protein